MATEASYPYTARDGTCKSSFTAAIPKGGVTGYKSVGNFLFGASKSDMQSALMQQPVSIAIEADQYASRRTSLVSFRQAAVPALTTVSLQLGTELRTARTTGS